MLDLTMLSVEIILLLGLALTVLSPWIHAALRRDSVWVFATFPTLMLVFLFTLFPQLDQQPIELFHLSWLPSLGIDLHLVADGWSVLFAFMIAALGLAIQIYTRGYFGNDPKVMRFQPWFLLFQIAMYGIVFSDNLISLFVFWELTSITSYLLIGFHREDPHARKSALRALLLTGSGGLALLAAFVLIGLETGTYSLIELVSYGPHLISSPAYPIILTLVLLGAFTKSAQFPFHFWLPGAMVAPTPVSAYLHSATMVKAGVFLLGAMHPILGGTASWQASLCLAGAITFLLGLVLALRERDMKSILAYTTVSALGTFTLLIGIGTNAAFAALVLLLINHALYKGALFLTTGVIDHELHTRDIGKISGLGKVMPLLSLGALLSVLAMAAFPPFLGFHGKEYWAQAAGEAEFFSQILGWVATAGALLTLPVAARLWMKPFLGRLPKKFKNIHAPGPTLVGPILALATLTLFLSVFPQVASKFLLDPAASYLAQDTVTILPKLFAGWTTKVLLTVLTFAFGIWLAVGRTPLSYDRIPKARKAGAYLTVSYDALIAETLSFAERFTTKIQTGLLRRDLLWIFLASSVLIVYSFLRTGGMPVTIADAFLEPLELQDAVVLALIGGGIAFTLVSLKKYAVIICLGLIGYGVALLFLIYGAPDLALTQLLVETLTLMLLLLAVKRLPDAPKLEFRPVEIRDAIIATFLAIVFAGMTLWAHAVAHSLDLREAMGNLSLIEAHGRNVVNVILVDFRSFDTYGEIIVLAIAAVGIFSLLKGFPFKRKGQKEADLS
jgi:multicomponent Na+:H+ antiporter subunit A